MSGAGSSGSSAGDSRQNVLNINIGILGHVDSGKTSLVKALSTCLSTAALDKNPQSQQRGITLDLGFSSFTLPLPEHLRISPDGSSVTPYDVLQFTLVDCPGHASLIRTIIGGAQIIDMIILVIDANKGVQTQTAECIVIGEITSELMIIALNKVDMIDECERQEKVEKVTKRIRRTLAGSKFATAPIVPVSAVVGGERVAAVTGSATTPASSSSLSTFKSSLPSLGIPQLVALLTSTATWPSRNPSSPFYYAIDHCFSIKGHGTVLTGTVLSGSVGVNQLIELPHLQATRKVKSLQMFRKPVLSAQQGDRVGLCVTNLDAKLIERGIACAPHTVPLLSAAICLVKKVRFFQLPCHSHSKFHITVGHTTVVASVVFFGGDELREVLSSGQARENAGGAGEATIGPATLCSHYERLFPAVSYPRDADFTLQTEILDTEGLVYGREPVQWAVLVFQQPIYCPVGSLIIASRLDADTSDARSAGAHLCRLAFFGPIRAVVSVPDRPAHTVLPGGTSPIPLAQLNVFQWREKHCEVVAVTDTRAGLCYEAVAWKLASERASIQSFLGMHVLTEHKVVGRIVSAYGAEGQFRVRFSHGARVKVGDRLLFRYKKYWFDKTRPIKQADVEDEVSPDLPDERLAEKEVKDGREKRKAKGGEVDRAGVVARETSAVAAVAPPLPLPSPPPPPPPSPPLPVSSPVTMQAPAVVETPPSEEGPVWDGVQREGKVESLKPDPDAADCWLAIVSGAFRMEENVKAFVGSKVRGPAGEVGTVVAAFGKLGKCKVRFPDKFTGQENSVVHVYA